MNYEIDLNNQADYQKSSGNGLNLASGDTVLLSNGATISATDGAGIHGTSNTSLLLVGKVKSNTGNAIHLLGGLHLISVGNGAEITGAAGIFVGQGGNDIKNFGSVTGTATYGIYAAGSNNTITNSGTLWGKTYGLVVGSAEAFGNYIENTGTIEGQETGVVLKGSATLTTSGLVKGTTGYAIDSQSAAGDVVSIINEAVITGGGTAILGGSGSESVANYGLINGSISLGDGNDIYDGTAGAVTGIVDLGGGNDKASGGVGSETLNGGGGNDTLIGGLGNDSLVGGSGNDTAVFIAAGGVTANLSTGQATGEGEDTLSGIENLTGGIGNDTFTGDSNANLLIGNGGSDVLTGDAGHDTLDGGLANDTLTGGTGNDLYIIDRIGDIIIETTDVGGGWDTAVISGSFMLSDTVGVEVLQANAGASFGAFMVGNNLANTLIGASGDDTLDGGAGLANDSFDGGSGTDTVVFSGAAGATVNLNTTLGQATGYGTDTFKNIENLTGGTGADNFTGDSAANVLTGNGGNDTLSGADGNDTLYGGAGSDSLLGGFGNDRLDGGTGDDTMAGGAGDDTYIIDSAGDQIIEPMNGGNGFDTALIFTNSYTVGSGVSLEVLQVDASVTSGATILDNIASSTIIGASGNDALHGSDGNDYLIGGAGDDSLYGGAGNDTLEGGAGNDYFHGLNGSDTVVYSGSQAVTVNLAVGTAQNVGTGYGFDTFVSPTIWNLTTGSGNDSLTGSSADNVFMANGGDDTLNGATGNDTLYGGSGNDSLMGAVGNDWLNGDEGDDVLIGGDGEDTLDGGSGNDTLEGGLKDDTYIIRSKTTKVTDTGGSANDKAYLFSSNYTEAELIKVKADLAAAGIEQIFVDALPSGPGNDTLVGTSGNDSINGGSGNDLLQGLGGDDHLDGGTGNDTLEGGLGNDYYVVDAASDVVLEDIDASGGNDTIELTVVNTYTLGNDTGIEVLRVNKGFATGVQLKGNDLANTIIGASHDDHLFGRGGDDQLEGGAGNDTLDGGADNDTAVYDTGWAVHVDLNTTFAQYTGVGTGTDVLIGIENVIGGQGGDTLIGNSGNNMLMGQEGTDSLVGGLGNDTLDSGIGYSGYVDTLVGGEGDDSYILRNVNSHVQDDGGMDTAYLFGFQYTKDELNAAIANLKSKNIEKIVIVNLPGDSGQDILIGTDANDYLAGAGGNDSLDGGDGDDTLNGGTGDDTLNGGADSDSLDGGGGDDTLDGGAGADTLTGGTGNDIYHIYDQNDVIIETIDAGGGIDTALIFINDYVLNDTIGIEVLQVDASVSSGAAVTGNNLANTLIGASGNDTLNGGGGNDQIDGGEGNDQIEGGSGNDVLSGGEGNDYLEGGAGDDSINGGAGDDWLDSGAGSNTLEGGLGDDTYIMRTPGTVVQPDAGGNDTAYIFRSNFKDDEALAAAIKYLQKNLKIETVIVDPVMGGKGDDSLVGGIDDDVLIDDGGKDTLKGGEGNDTIHGMDDDDTIEGNDGDDSLEGGKGNDSLDGGKGNDTLKGSDGNDTLLGGEGNDSLVGGAGDDTLDGGPGQDTMAGGAGNDTYYIHDINDVIVEDPDPLVGGIDTALVFAGSYALGTNVGVEVLKAAVDTGVALTGNALANTIIGGKGNDTLDGGKGAANTFQGGEGNDVYYLRNKNDLVLKDDDGVDTAHIYKDNYTQAELAQLLLDLAEAGIENVIQEDGTGATNKAPTGLTLSSNTVVEVSAVGTKIATLVPVDENLGDPNESFTFSIVTDAGSNLMTLNDGRFRIVGDTLQVANRLKFDYEIDPKHTMTLTIRVTDKAGLFVDTAVTIKVLDYIGENVTGSAGPDEIWGGVGADFFNGGGGNDTLVGGFGPDTLTGGAGDDVFRFASSPLKGHVDTIMDFKANGGNDKLYVDTSKFLLGAGNKALPTSMFALSTDTLTAQDRFIYNQQTGALYYDQDGIGVKAAVQIARFSPNSATKPVLSAADFWVV